MAVSAGRGFSLAVTENGSIVAFGRNSNGQLGNGLLINQDAPILLDKNLVFAGQDVVMVSAGNAHSACVTMDGSVWTWGANSEGQLGLDHNLDQTTPVRITRNQFGDSRALMVACGHFYTMVLTSEGHVWTCGNNEFGQLGFHDNVPRMRLTQILPASFDGMLIGMIAAGIGHCLALSKDDGTLWAWGLNSSGELGLGDETEAVVVSIPHPVSRNAFAGSAVTFIEAGWRCSMVVTADNALYACGAHANWGPDDNWAMQRVGGADVFGEAGVRMVSCGLRHTLIVGHNGTLWTIGNGLFPVLGTNNQIGVDNIRPVDIPRDYLDDDDVIVAAAGKMHSIVVTGHGKLYSWGCGSDHSQGGGLGYTSVQGQSLPRPVLDNTFGGEHIGRWHNATEENTIAFLLGYNTDHAMSGVGEEILQYIFSQMRLRSRDGTSPGFQNLIGVPALWRD